MSVHLVVINLNKRRDRWVSLQKHLDDFKDKLSFIASVHRIEAVECIPPAKGCMLSHAKAIQLAKDQFWDRVLVVEDDIRFQENVLDTWNAIQSDLSNVNWSILFGASVRIRPNDVKPFTSNLFKLNHPNGIFTGTHCMLYHSKSYDAILDCIAEECKSDFPYHLDLLLSTKLNTKETPILLAIPFLALFTENDTSDIRIGKDTSIDYQNIVHAQQTALKLRK
jgi:GR25 family glycosyltransferase involved in LPS biosynthesis